MAYAFVPARYNYGKRKGPALALVVHMAEGGNTVNYLKNNPPRGVSVHFVLERSGRIVQMLPLSKASGSIDPGRLRTTNDRPYSGYNAEIVQHGFSAVKSILGAWSRDPNSAIISIEVEGFARNGPNEKQREALVRWSRDMRKKLPTLRGVLGHRDFANYKACPGKFIPWENMAFEGHG